MGEAEDGTEGIVVYAQGFLGGAHGANEFRFMSTEVSRERPVNYEELAARVGEEKRRGGYLVWVVGPGAGALACPGRLRVVHPQRLRAGGAGRERGRGARHRGGDLRHHARHEQHRPAHRGRPRPPHAGDQQGAGGRLHRARGRDRAHQERHHARAGRPTRCPTCWPARSATTARCRASTATALAGAGRDAGAHGEGHRRGLRGHRAARDRGRQHAAGVLPLRRRAVAAHDDLRGPDRVRGEQAEGSRDPPGLRRGDQRAGLHARAPLLHRALGAGAPSDRRARHRLGPARRRGGGSAAARRGGRRLDLQPAAARGQGVGHRGR